MKRANFVRFVKFAAVFSVLIGVAALIISISILNGFEKGIEENAIKFTSHIQAETYKQIPIQNFDEAIRRLKLQFPLVKSAAPYIQKEALISSKKSVDGASIKAIRPGDDITNIKSKIIQGEFPKTGANQILISQRLSEKLKLKIGDLATVYLVKNRDFRAEQFPEIEKFQISGIYKTGMAKYDDLAVFADLNYIQTILGYAPNHCGGIDVMLKDVSNISQTTKSIEAFLDFPFICYNVYEIHSAMFAWIDLQKKPIPIVLTLISIVAAMNIITILLIIIVEKTHTIGILRTLGMSSQAIMSIFLIRGLSLGALGAFLGAGIAYAFSYLQQTYALIKLNGEVYFLDALPIKIDINTYVLVVSASLILSFLITFIPAFIALRVKAVKAINFR
jgi:lipoprotein-releasing system permease protein